LFKKLKLNSIKQIKRFRSGGDTKYISHMSIEYYKELGIIHETIAPYSPEMNVKAEIKNRTFTELVVAICLLVFLANKYRLILIITRRTKPEILGHVVHSVVVRSSSS